MSLLALKHSSLQETCGSAASTLTSALFNIRSIATHFVPKVDAFSAANQTSSLSAAQVSCNIFTKLIPKSLLSFRF